MSTYRNENVQNIHQVDDVISPARSKQTAAVPIYLSEDQWKGEVSTEESVGVRGSSVNLESSTLEGMEIPGVLDADARSRALIRVGNSYQVHHTYKTYGVLWPMATYTSRGGCLLNGVVEGNAVTLE